MASVTQEAIAAARLSAWNDGEWIEGEMEDVAQAFGCTVRQLVDELEKGDS